MDKQIRRTLAWLMSAALVVWTSVPAAFAVTTDSIVLTVTPSCTRGITVSAAPEPYDFGSVAFNTSTHSTRAVTVTNDASSTCADTWDLQAANSGGTPVWDTVTSAPAADAYRLSALFNTGLPLETDFGANDYVNDASATLCDATKFAGGVTCLNVPVNTSRSLWFKLEMPSSSTEATAVTHTITVTITTL